MCLFRWQVTKATTHTRLASYNIIENKRSLGEIKIVGRDMIYRLHLSLGTFTPCTAPTGTLQMTTDAIKSLQSDYCLRISIPIMPITLLDLPLFTYLSLKPHDVLPCLGNLLMISA